MLCEGLNVGLEYLNLSWNMLRGNGAIAICKSLNVNNTVREINLSWNGFGFHGCLALSEALKVNIYVVKVFCYVVIRIQTRINH